MASSSSDSLLCEMRENPGAEFANALRELDVMCEAEPVIVSKEEPPTKSKKKARVAGNGTGFGGNQSGTVEKAVQDGLNRASKVEGVQDEKLKNCFEKLRKNIPGALKSTPMLNMLKESKGFCSTFLQLLRNDSLLDIGSRMELYRSLLGVLLLLAKHPSTAEFLYHPLYQDPEDSSNNSSTCKQLLSLLGAQAKVFLQLQGKPVTTPKKRKAFDEVEIIEMDESIVMATIITDTVRAVDSFIDLTTDTGSASVSHRTDSNARPTSGSNGGGGVVDLTLDDGDDFVMWVPSPNTSSNTSSNAASSSTDYNSSSSSSAGNNGSSSSSKGQGSSKKSKTQPSADYSAEYLQNEENEYPRRLAPLRFEVIELCAMIASGQTSHLFSSQSGATPAAAHPLAAYGHHPHHAPPPVIASNPKQRMTRIAKEMATLSTNLPVEFGSSVFVRVDESRMDLIKALIVGPLGTPYANGCFEFDIYLPGDYPNVPPKVLLRTTGQGTVRFNPNLYNCGKVCLSLLGTWAGPGWDPKLSTLLQVLVSIQSLILVPDPFYNEPGYQVGHHKAASDAYTKNIKKQCLAHAVLGQLKAPPTVFADVVRAHFKHKRLSLAVQMAEWVRETPALKSLASQIQAELDLLG